MKLCKAIFDWTSEELAIRGTFYDQFHMFTSGSLIVGVPSTFSTWIIGRLTVTIHRTSLSPNVVKPGIRPFAHSYFVLSYTM